MNLDDFIFSENISTPAGLPLDPASPELLKLSEDKAAHATAAAIPIKSRKVSPQQHFVPQSVPVPPHRGHEDEFGYVNRHHRKTSIDDRRVSTLTSPPPIPLAIYLSTTYIPTVPPKKCLPNPAMPSTECTDAPCIHISELSLHCDAISRQDRHPFYHGALIT
jgi:hypothetical protein